MTLRNCPHKSSRLRSSFRSSPFKYILSNIKYQNAQISLIFIKNLKIPSPCGFEFPFLFLFVSSLLMAQISNAYTFSSLFPLTQCFPSYHNPVPSTTSMLKLFSQRSARGANQPPSHCHPHQTWCRCGLSNPREHGAKYAVFCELFW